MKGTRNMTKKEYLESIGYKYYKGEDIYKQAFENNNGDYLVIAYIDARFNDFYVVPDTIYSQKNIDFAQIVFNNVKRDFEETQKYED